MSDFKLYDFSEQYEGLLEYLEDNPDLDEEVLKDTLEGITDGAKERIDNIAGLIQKFTDDVDNIKKRQGELAQLKKQKEKSIAWLKDYLVLNMNKLELKKVDSGTRVVSLAKSPPSIVIHQPEKLPEEFKTYKTVVDISSEQLPKPLQEKLIESEVKYDYREVLRYLKDLDSNGDISYQQYAELIKDKQNIRIK